MGRVVSPYLIAVGAAWEDGPHAGGWIADRLGPFGASVGHAVPRGYARYVAVPIPWDDDPAGVRGPLIALEMLLDVLAAFTGERPVHCGMWDGWSWWYEPGTDPRVNSGVGVTWWEHGPMPPQAEIDRARREARECAAVKRVQRPDVMPLVLPNRSYHPWTGPLRAAIAIADPAAVVDAVLAVAQLNARRVVADDELARED